MENVLLDRWNIKIISENMFQDIEKAEVKIKQAMIEINCLNRKIEILQNCINNFVAEKHEQKGK